MLFAALVVIVAIIAFYSSTRFKNYTAPKIYRLDFLPPYEEVEQFIVNARSGNINWKIFARDATIKLAKKGLTKTTKLSVSAKELSVDLAKKGAQVVKTKAESILKKTKRWGHKGKENDELMEDEDDF